MRRIGSISHVRKSPLFVVVILSVIAMLPLPSGARTSQRDESSFNWFDGGGGDLEFSAWSDASAMSSCSDSDGPSGIHDRMVGESDGKHSSALETVLRNALAETPMALMVDDIALLDEQTALFLVAIARKESSWGMHAPLKDGSDCFNYWGFKGLGDRGSSLGYACFKSRREAVEIVGSRLSNLVHGHRLDSPEKLVIWKCGSSCAAHDQRSVEKWISDVRSIYNLISSEKREIL